MTVNYQHLVFGMALAFLAGCDQHYRVTAEVEADGHTYVGSSVQKFYCQEGGGAFGNLQVGHCEVEGEAIVVKMGNRGTLFVLMRDGTRDTKTGKRRIGSAADMLAALQLTPTRDAPASSAATWEIDSKHLPAMITFKDPRNPLSVEMVEPDDLAATFGPDVRFRRFAVSHTFSKVSAGPVDAALPWLGSLHPSGNLKGKLVRSSDDRSLPAKLDVDGLKRKF